MLLQVTVVRCIPLPEPSEPLPNTQKSQQSTQNPTIEGDNPTIEGDNPTIEANCVTEWFLDPHDDREDKNNTPKKL